ncbi:MAG: hypothetical protein RIQ93_2807 [Verrucomicrobiota bacterium]|jgi:hypothetical protein
MKRRETHARSARLDKKRSGVQRIRPESENA